MSHSSSRPRSHRSRTSSSSGSARSYASDQSRSTAPTVYSDRPTFKRHDTSPAYAYHHPGLLSTSEESNPRASVETYASTIDFSEDSTPQPEYELPLERERILASTVIPTIPSEFADLFEAGRRIHIEHDDSTSDGNMNLCLDTEISVSGERRKMRLFHLRMRDLRDRQFSLRRHCRDSGREVCKSSRKYGPVPEIRKASKRPVLQRSLSSAISSLMGARERERERESESESGSFRRHEVADTSLQAHHKLPRLSSDSIDDAVSEKSKAVVPTNTIRLEFSNYALVEIHTSGTRSGKEYDFEYWGSQYCWKRQVRRDGHCKATSYHLFNALSNEAIAHITPELLTRQQAAEEEYKGGWVPPCSLFITDPRAFSTDLADVIVATGLVTLVDDCITRRWHSRGGMVLHIPTKNSPHYITPRQLIDEIFNRRGHTAT